MTIPKVSIERIGLDVDDPTRKSYEGVGKDLFEAFASVGFVYVTGHGVEPEMIDDCMRSSRKFFELPYSDKARYLDDSVVPQGYVEAGREVFTDTTNEITHELKETFDLTMLDGEHTFFPDDTVPEFRALFTSLANKSKELSLRVMRSLAVSLNLDVDFFDARHSKMFSAGSTTKLRSLYYPKILEGVKAGVTRLGEHTDFGTITLLYQDSIGGLEVKGVDNVWMRADPMEGSVLINAGDLLEIMTSGTLPATFHRVVVPEEETKRKTVRQSIVFFVQPDDEVAIQPLPGYENTEGLEKYRPTTALKHLERRLAASYRY